MDSIFQGSQAYHGCDSLACRHADLFKVHRRECWASLARTSDVGAESDHLGSVTCGFRRPISSFGGHMINTRCSCHYDSLLSKNLDSLQLCSAKSIEEHFLSPILQGNVTTSPISQLALRNRFTPSLFNRISQDASLQCRQLNHQTIIP
jgi:hypothetical protein